MGISRAYARQGRRGFLALSPVVVGVLALAGCGSSAESVSSLSALTPALIGEEVSVPRSRKNAHCAVAADPEYGRTPDKPVQVGGGFRSGPARELRYLSVLRGPSGEGIKFRRCGSTSSRGFGFVDLYSVWHEGLSEAITLYLSFYSYVEPSLPQGFTCTELFFDPAPGSGAPSSKRIQTDAAVVCR